MISRVCVGCAKIISGKVAPTKMIKPMLKVPKWRVCLKFTRVLKIYCQFIINTKYLFSFKPASENERKSLFLMSWCVSTHLFLSERNRSLLESVESVVTLFISAFTLLQCTDVRTKNTTLAISKIVTGPIKKVNSPYERRLSVTFH